MNAGIAAPDAVGAPLVIGFGNRFRSDDAAGLIVAAEVRAAAPDARVIEAEGEPTALIDLWTGADTVYVVDAVASGGSPGAIHRFDAAVETPPAPFTHRGTHALSLADVVELARALDRMPGALIIYGIEGARFDAGVKLSRPVRAASRTATARLLEELDAHASAIKEP